MNDLTHPADGLYYINAEMLVRGDACKEHSAAFHESFGTADAPITLAALVTHFDRYGRCGYWLAAVMKDRNLLTQESWVRFNARYHHGSRVDAAKDVMDLLMERAKHEGRIV